MNFEWKKFLLGNFSGSKKVKDVFLIIAFLAIIFSFYEPGLFVKANSEIIGPASINEQTFKQNINFDSSNKINQYEIFEIAFDINGLPADTNYFWPYEAKTASTPPSINSDKGVTVEAVFTNDSGQALTVPAFYYQGYKDVDNLSASMSEYNGSVQYPVGTSSWHVRFSPEQTGNWTYQIKATYNGGSFTYNNSINNKPLAFSCDPALSGNHGFVKVSPTDSRYFELSDGTPLLGPGINSEFHNLREAKQLMQKFGDNKVEMVRFWMNFRQWQAPFGGVGDSGTQLPQWNFSNKNLQILTSAKARTAGDRYANQGSAEQNFYIDSSVKNYQISGYYRDGDIVISLAGMSCNTASPGINCIIAADQNGWKKFTLSFNVPSAGVYKLSVGGGGLYDELSINETINGQPLGGNYLSKSNFDFENYVDLKESWKVDQLFQLAKDNGVYLKPVISEYYDQSLGWIQPDGSTANYNTVSNFFGTDSHPSRWLQKAWWRYMAARWGAYSSLHSWDMVNEGDPEPGYNATTQQYVDSAHYNAAKAFATEIHTSYPARRQLAATSFWHSIPMDFWSAKDPNGDYIFDYVDAHEYIGPTDKQTTSNGPRFYAWGDPTQDANNTNALAVGGLTIRDSALYYETATSGGNVGRFFPQPYYHIGVDPSHKYTLSFSAKTEDYRINDAFSDGQTSITIYWSRKYKENSCFKEGVNPDAQNGGCLVQRLKIDPTWDKKGWKTYTLSNILPPTVNYLGKDVVANTANILIEYGMNSKTVSKQWIDNIQFTDQTNPSKNLFVDGTFDGLNRIDRDVPLAVKKYGTWLGSYSSRINGPGMWSETGIRKADAPAGTYDEEPQLADPKNKDGLDVKKFIWANVGPDNPNMLFWWTRNMEDPAIGKNLWPYFKNFQDFMMGTNVSNGKYRDITPNTTIIGDSRLQIYGQQEFNGNEADRANLWINNSSYTWYNAVNSPSSEVNLSGTIKVAGFKPGNYTIEQWNTATGSHSNIASGAEPQSGVLQFDISNLASDTAIKIFSTGIVASPVPTPPTTIADGDECLFGQCTNEVSTFTFTAVPYSKSAEEKIKNIYYSTDNSSFNICPDNLSICRISLKLNSGNNTIYYFSKDINGDRESTKSLNFEYNPPSQPPPIEPPVTPIPIPYIPPPASFPEPTSSQTVRRLGDANGDGVIDSIDLSILADEWEKEVTPNTGADFNGDGIVDSSDLSILADQWGK